MGKVVTGLIGLVVGAVLGLVAAASLGGGAMMGAGVAAGLSAGICSVVKAAQDEGIMSAGQVDQVLSRAAADLGGKLELAEGEQIVGAAAECQKVLDALAKHSTR